MFERFKRDKSKPRSDLAQPFRRVKDTWHRNHIAYRDVLDFDLEKKRFILNRSTISEEDFNPDDLIVDGEKWKKFRASLELPTVPDTRTEVGEDGIERTYLNPTPISWNLYYESDAINNASAGEFRNALLSPLVLALIIGGGILMLLLLLL